MSLEGDNKLKGADVLPLAPDSLGIVMAAGVAGFEPRNCKTKFEPIFAEDILVPRS